MDITKRAFSGTLSFSLVFASLSFSLSLFFFHNGERYLSVFTINSQTKKKIIKVAKGK